MAKIKVKLETFCGHGCIGLGDFVREFLEVELSEKELEVLRKIGKETISSEDIEQFLDDGDTTLESLHNKLSELFYDMTIRYCISDAKTVEGYHEWLLKCMEKDIKEGVYVPEDHGDYGADNDYGFFGCRGCCGYYDDEEESGDDKAVEDEDMEERKREYNMDIYCEWVEEHGQEFVAYRYGLDIDACRECYIPTYEIEILND